jgi:general secretion pathway protein I
MSHRLHARGFTLLEAIVAIAILGIALIPLLSFTSQSVLQLHAAADSNARSLAEQNVLAFLETVNPLDQPTGNTTLGDLRVEWSSKPIVDQTRNTTPGSALPYYDIGFYWVDVRVSRDGANPWFEFAARKVGYRAPVVHGFGSTP